MEDDENNFSKIMGNRQIIDNEEVDGEEEEQDQFTTAKTQLEGFDGSASRIQESDIGGRRSTLPFGKTKTNKSINFALGVRGLFMLNLIKNAFIEQHFDYCNKLCQQLIQRLTEMSEKLELNHHFLKFNAIRFRWLAKE